MPNKPIFGADRLPAHRAMMKLMQDAADAVHAELLANPPALPKGDKAL